MLEQHQHALEQQMQKLEHHRIALQRKIAHKKAFLVQQDAASHSASPSDRSEAEIGSFDL
jgi:hypothetical protein